jgi:hypothetical protein
MGLLLLVIVLVLVFGGLPRWGFTHMAMRHQALARCC